MSFVKDNESLWELITIEQDIENMGVHATITDMVAGHSQIMKAFD
jgi:hypothetical protein